ncbi:hypothetical protein EST38_g3090 [Candolleomyces aberdarensis]|uniref:F-box domain-containing protein n=1 Tax=Candolleomyces aberdarensis TaxID=2316362 RepID=A0A4Q2DRF2_9AGAR|nr:hypothetical protein EST38_g3090 [Candolleomyces aberdarensis]
MKSLNFAKRNSATPLESDPDGFKTESTNKGSTFSRPLGSLTKLPPELLLQIINELDDAALCDLGCTCRDFNSLIFPMLFDKLYITHYLPVGWLWCSQASRYTLRAIRCSLPTRKFNNICHCFRNGLENLEEIEEMHAIVTRMDELGEFRVFALLPNEWPMTEIPGLDETQATLTEPFAIKALLPVSQNGIYRWPNVSNRFPWKSDIFLTSPSFLNWTNQALSWCASTLTHLELECPEAPRRIWCKFLSKLKLPSLISFKIASGVFVKANVPGSDIRGFLSRHPGIQKLYLHGIQVSACSSSGKPTLPNLTEVTAHPIWISWLLRNEEQSPKLKEITLLTEYYTDTDGPFEYDAMDRALKKILLRSYNLDLIAFKFTCVRGNLDFWLQSHVEAGSNSILSSFINTKHLRIDWAYRVRLLNSASRLNLVAQVAGLFPNLGYLELKDLLDVPDKKTDHIPPVIEALRQHSPQVKKVKINDQDPIDIANFQSSEEE